MESAISIKIFSIIIYFTVLMLNARDDFKNEKLSKDLHLLLILLIVRDFFMILAFGQERWFPGVVLINELSMVFAEMIYAAIYFVAIFYVKHSVVEEKNVNRKALLTCHITGAFYYAICILALISSICSPGGYPRAGYIVYCVIVVLCYVSIIIFIASTKKFNTQMETRLLLGFTFMLGVDAVISMLGWFNYHGIGSVVLVIMMYIVFHQNRIKKYIAMERDYNEAQHALLMAQVKPHFMFNTLATIRVLLSVDQEKGLHLLDTFNNYLRNNIDNFDSTELVPFEKELQQLRSYIDIQQVRFPYIEVKYDIKEMDFTLPMFILQPIVENSIKHGLRPKKSGGALLTISTDLDENTGNVVIIIEDTGVGFVEEELDLSDRNHIGVKNTRQRLKDLCNGTMEVWSEKGVGTKTTITLNT